MSQIVPEAQARKTQALRQAMGPVLAAALVDPAVVEVMVNADGRIWVERVGQGRIFSGQRMSPADAERILRLVADHAGEVVTRDQPLVSATLPESGERFQGVYMPVATAPCFAIRKRPAIIFTLADYVASGVMSARQADILRKAAAERANIVIAGGTGSGKTTLANAVLAEEAFRQDRVALLEDTPELQCSALDQFALLTRRADPGVSMADLVRTSLRLRPDRIVIGEVRDGSALDLLKAWNTGHPGGLTTLHANSAAEALSRLEDLVGEVSPRVPRRAIAGAIDLVVYLKRAAAGRILETILSVDGWRNEAYVLTEIG